MEGTTALEKAYRAQREASHEFQHHLQALHDLLNNAQSLAARDYVQKLQTVQTVRVLAVNSHHPVIDAILNQKYQNAKDLGIDMHIQVNDLSSVALPADVLVVLLSNLLDNAVEACQKVQNPTVSCEILCQGSRSFTIWYPWDSPRYRTPSTQESNKPHFCCGSIIEMPPFT